jgi:ribose transport system permease protein
MPNPVDISIIAKEFQSKIQQEERRDKFIQLAPVLILVMLVIVFSIFRFNSFFTFYNLTNILNQLSMVLIIALGITFVTLIGSVDLSVDGVVGFAASIVSVLVLNSKNVNNFGVLGVLFSLLLGVICGFISGTIYVKFKISSFMVTYAMSAIVTGFGIMSYRGRFAQIRDPFLMSIPQAFFVGIPLITWIAFIVLIIAWIIQERTSFGRYMIAVGTNEIVPKMAGIKINQVKVVVFMWSGFCFSLAGILGALRLSRGEVDVGIGQFFPAQAAVVIGGTSLAGGRGGVLNTLVGALIITVLNNGLLLMNVNMYIREGLQGFIILIAVMLSSVHSKRVIVK